MENWFKIMSRNERLQNPQISRNRSKCGNFSKVGNIRYYCTKDKDHDGNEHFAKLERKYHFHGSYEEPEPVTKEIEIFAFWVNIPIDQAERPIYHQR